MGLICSILLANNVSRFNFYEEFDFQVFVIKKMCFGVVKMCFGVVKGVKNLQKFFGLICSILLANNVSRSNFYEAFDFQVQVYFIKTRKAMPSGLERSNSKILETSSYIGQQNSGNGQFSVEVW